MEYHNQFNPVKPSKLTVVIPLFKSINEQREEENQKRKRILYTENLRCPTAEEKQQLRDYYRRDPHPTYDNGTLQLIRNKFPIQYKNHFDPNSKISINRENLDYEEYCQQMYSEKFQKSSMLTEDFGRNGSDQAEFLHLYQKCQKIASHLPSPKSTKTPEGYQIPPLSPSPQIFIRNGSISNHEQFNGGLSKSLTINPSQSVNASLSNSISPSRNEIAKKQVSILQSQSNLSCIQPIHNISSPNNSPHNPTKSSIQISQIINYQDLKSLNGSPDRNPLQLLQTLENQSLIITENELAQQRAIQLMVQNQKSQSPVSQDLNNLRRPMKRSDKSPEQKSIKDFQYLEKFAQKCVQDLDLNGRKKNTFKLNQVIKSQKQRLSPQGAAFSTKIREDSTDKYLKSLLTQSQKQKEEVDFKSELDQLNLQNSKESVDESRIFDLEQKDLQIQKKKNVLYTGSAYNTNTEQKPSSKAKKSRLSNALQLIDQRLNILSERQRHATQADQSAKAINESTEQPERFNTLHNETEKSRAAQPAVLRTPTTLRSSNPRRKSSFYRHTQQFKSPSQIEDSPRKEKIPNNVGDYILDNVHKLSRFYTPVRSRNTLSNLDNMNNNSSSGHHQPDTTFNFIQNYKAPKKDSIAKIQDQIQMIGIIKQCVFEKGITKGDNKYVDSFQKEIQNETNNWGMMLITEEEKDLIKEEKFINDYQKIHQYLSKNIINDTNQVLDQNNLPDVTKKYLKSQLQTDIKNPRYYYSILMESNKQKLLQGKLNIQCYNHQQNKQIQQIVYPEFLSK